MSESHGLGTREDQFFRKEEQKGRARNVRVLQLRISTFSNYQTFHWIWKGVLEKDLRSYGMAFSFFNFEFGSHKT